MDRAASAIRFLQLEPPALTREMRHPLPANGAAAKAGRGVPRREPAQAAGRRIRFPRYKRAVKF